jgi:periplasmic divalent cation tolerance protein
MFFDDVLIIIFIFFNLCSSVAKKCLSLALQEPYFLPRLSRLTIDLSDYYFMVIIFTTTPNETEAENLATKLVEQKLAACVQVFPKIKSFYFWEDEIQKDSEYLLLIKTAAEMFDKVESFIKANHSYENPEIVGIRVDYTSADYQNWMNKYLGIIN